MSKLEELLDKLSIKFLDKGKDYIVRCTNPEHDDTHPSMRIDKLTGIYHCFSCGHKGNILKEHGVQTNIVDTKALKILEKIRNLQRKGIDIPLGAIPFTTDFRGISGKTLKYFEAFVHPDYEDRIIFPLRDITGDIQVFITRHMYSNVQPKYVFDPAHTTPPLFPSKPISIENSSIILVEGIFDALNLIDKGLQNAVCAFGTNTLFRSYREKLEYLKIMGVEKIYIMFDGDKPGREAASKLEEIINKTITTKRGTTISPLFEAEVVELPDKTDPGSLSQDDVNYIKREMYG